MCATTKVHPFEAAGLGIAPFAMISYTLKQGPIVREDGTQIGCPGQPMGTCEYCGQGIAHCYQIRSSDGKTFIVGSDCAEKVDPEYRKEAKTFRGDYEARKYRLEARIRHEAQLQAQRAKNGGLTDSELQARREKEAEEARKSKLDAMRDGLAKAFPVGKRVELQVRKVFSTSDLGSYGTWHLSKLEIVGGEFDGLPVTYFNSIGLAKGEEGTIRGTIKEIGEYKGEPQIVIQRAKLMESKVNQ